MRNSVRSAVSASVQKNNNAAHENNNRIDASNRDVPRAPRGARADTPSFAAEPYVFAQKNSSSRAQTSNRKAPFNGVLCFRRKNTGKCPGVTDGTRSAGARAATCATLETHMSASKRQENAMGGRRAEAFAQTPLSEEPKKSEEIAKGRRSMGAFAQTLPCEEPKERSTCAAQIRCTKPLSGGGYGSDIPQVG